ncbi:MAG: glucose 1-dehydrogenase [Nitriliruptor sp.]|nr:MAG: glucose 1-dehydrogenase [Nitriliruptor sp.]
MSGRLADKVVIITGAGSGIGARAAERFAEEGAAIVCADIVGADATATAITEQGGRAIGMAADVTSPEDSRAMAELGMETYGAVDVLFANAGIAGFGSTADCDMETWDRVMAVNLTGVWLSMRAVLPTMTARAQGSIIATASVAGIKGIRGIAPYSASKAGVIGLVRATAVEVGPNGVRVNALVPGTTPTPLVTDTFSAMVGGGAPADSERTRRALEREQQRYPLRRFGTRDEVVDAALYLAGDDSRWVTGTTHVVDGGLAAT